MLLFVASIDGVVTALLRRSHRVSLALRLGIAPTRTSLNYLRPSSPVELSRTSSTLQSASFSKESLSALFNIASVFFQSRKTKLPTLPPPVSNYPPAKPSRCAPNTSTSTIAAVPTQKEMSSTAPNEAHLALGCASKSADERATTAPNTAANRRDSLQVSGRRIFLEGAAPTT